MNITLKTFTSSTSPVILLLVERNTGDLSNNNVYHTEALYFRGLARIRIGDKSPGCEDLMKAKDRGDKDADEKLKEFCQ